MIHPELLPAIKKECRDNPARFNRRILGGGAFWWRQNEIAESVVNYPTTLVQSGNAIGKSFCDARIILWFLYNRPGCLVVATAPSQTQLEEVLWKQVESAFNNSRVPLGGRALKNPLKIEVDGEWQALAYSTSKTERFSGHHRGDLLAVIDEGSGVDPDIWEAFDSLNPSRLLVTGNPLRPSGPFYERCMRARERIESGNLDPLVNWIQISSLESPDIDLPRSPRGLADATWLERSRNDWGEGTAWWAAHVLGEFPGSEASQVFPAEWLVAAGMAVHQPGGWARLAIDLGGGNDGDKTVLLVRDGNGLLHVELSATYSFETTATKAALLAQKFGVEPHRVSFDAAGLGHDFGARLKAVGLHGARAYVGGRKGGAKFVNLRSAAAWAARQRLDPKRTIRDMAGKISTQPAFAVRQDWMAQLRPELLGMRYRLAMGDKVALEPKETLAKTLGHSPDVGDAFIQSFAYVD